MVNCENCGVENAARYCGECVRVMQEESAQQQYEAEIHAEAADADRFEVEVDFEPELDSDEGDGYPNDSEGYECPEFDE